jgi:hypothetical protein
MDVVFEEEEEPVRPVAPVKQSLLSKLVISTGIAKTVAQAEQAMLFIAIGALVLAVGIVLIANRPPPAASQSAINAAAVRIEAQQVQSEQTPQ